MVLAPLALALSLAAAGPPDPSVRQEVEALLGVIHGPVPVERLRALGPEAIDVLADVAVKPGLNLRRARALDALAALGGARALDVHRAVLGRTREPRSVRRAAVFGLGRLAGPAQAAAHLTPFLDGDPDPAVRAAAAETLAARAPAECGRVLARAKAEQEPARFARAVRTCDRAREAKPPRR